MDQEAAIQAFVDRHTSPLSKQIFSTYMRTPEGRLKLAHSMVQPSRILIEYLGRNKGLSSIDVQNRIDDYKSFLSAVPDEEKGFAPFLELQGNLTQLQEHLYPPA